FRSSARTLSRNSRVSGTIFRWAVLGRFSFFSTLGSAAVATVVSSGWGAKPTVGIPWERDLFSAGAAQGGNGEDYRIELLKIPQFRKVKTDRRRLKQAANFHLLDEPSKALIHGRLSLAAAVEQDFHGEGRLFHARGRVARAAPAAVGILNIEQPSDAAPGRFRVHHIE